MKHKLNILYLRWPQPRLMDICIGSQVNFGDTFMSHIGIGIIGGGYMGKAHSVAFASVASVFETALRPQLVSICARTAASAEAYSKAYGFKKFFYSKIYCN